MEILSQKHKVAILFAQINGIYLEVESYHAKPAMRRYWKKKHLQEQARIVLLTLPLNLN